MSVSVSVQIDCSTIWFGLTRQSVKKMLWLLRREVTHHHQTRLILAETFSTKLTVKQARLTLSLENGQFASSVLYFCFFAELLAFLTLAHCPDPKFVGSWLKTTFCPSDLRAFLQMYNWAASYDTFSPAGRSTCEKEASVREGTSCSPAFCKKLLIWQLFPADRAGDLQCSPARPLAVFRALPSTLAQPYCPAPQPLGSPDAFFIFSSALVHLSLVRDSVFTIFIFSLYFLHPAGPASFGFLWGMTWCQLIFLLTSIQAATQ